MPLAEISGWEGLIGLLFLVGFIVTILGTIGFFFLRWGLSDEYKI